MAVTNDTTHLSGPLLDYYAALAENMPNPKLVKHQHDDEYICIVGKQADCGLYYSIDAYSPTTNPALAFQLLESLAKSKDVSIEPIDGIIHFTIQEQQCWRFMNPQTSKACGDNLPEAALRALVAWKFPDGLPEPIYESEK